MSDICHACQSGVMTPETFYTWYGDCPHDGCPWKGYLRAEEAERLLRNIIVHPKGSEEYETYRAEVEAFLERNSKP